MRLQSCVDEESLRDEAEKRVEKQTSVEIFVSLPSLALIKHLCSASEALVLGAVDEDFLSSFFSSFCSSTGANGYNTRVSEKQSTSLYCDENSSSCLCLSIQFC